MIASTFWKNTIPLCTGCDQFLVVVGEVARGVEELLRHDRRPQPDVGQREAFPGLVYLAAAIEVLARRGAVEFDDDLAL
jgi:hypothetical protein